MSIPPEMKEQNELSIKKKKKKVFLGIEAAWSFKQ